MNHTASDTDKPSHDRESSPTTFAPTPFPSNNNQDGVTPTSSRDPIRAGDKVEARYKGKLKYYPGTATRVNADGTYDIHYNDGDHEFAVQAAFVRPATPPTAASTTTVKASAEAPPIATSAKEAALAPQRAALQDADDDDDYSKDSYD